jgi:hypothetical protein
MNRLRTLVVILFLLGLPVSAMCQAKIYGDVGLSYIEHFSLGGGVTFRNHSLGVLYGSNFFVHPKKFSNFFGQYQLAVPRFTFANLIPLIGVKGGHTVFSDRYYRWNVASLIPFIGLQYPLTDQLNLYTHAGVAFSFEQSVTRLNFGEIGHYKNKLPELKVGVNFKFIRTKE